MQDGERKVLVLGYGNDLRGDDGVGPCVAAAVAAKRWPDVCSLAAAQLTPELAEVIATVEMVIFVDACVGPDQGVVTVRRLQAASHDENLSHSSSPVALLHLAQIVYGRAPDAWLVSIAGSSFGVGEQVSDAVQNNIDAALQRIDELVSHTKDAGDAD